MKDSLYSIKNLRDRLLAEIPLFWKQVRALMIVLGTIGTAIRVGNAQLIAEKLQPLPDFVLHYAGYLIVIGFVGAGLAQLTAKNLPANNPPQPPADPKN